MSATTYPDFDSWLAAPRYIGSSRSPGILGCGYADQSAISILMEMTGAAPMPQEERESLEIGRLMQPVILELLRRRTNYEIQPLDYTLYRHEELPWLGATPDGLIHDPVRGIGAIEAKNVGEYNAHEWREELPLRVQVQTQHQMLCMGASYAVIVGLIGGNRLVYREIPRHDRFIGAMLPRLRDFWGYVERWPTHQELPPIDGSEATARALARLYAKCNGDETSLSPQFVGVFDELQTIKAEQKKLKERRTALENQVKAALGKAETGWLPDGRRFSWKEQTAEYAAQEARESTSRVLRQHEAPRHKIER